MTTKLCTKCNTIKSTAEFGNHSKSKDGKQYQCKECRNKNGRESRQKDNSNHKEILKKSYQKHKEKRLKEKEDYRNSNRNLLAEKQKEYYQEHKENYIDYQKTYRVKNKDKILEKYKKYRKTNNYKISRRNSSNKRRTITKTGDVTTQQLQELYENSKFCYWCNTNLKNKKIHLDHYIPLSKGGQHTLSNLVVSCPHCNHIKSSKDPIEFANSIGRLI